MTVQERTKLVNRIVSGETRLKINGRVLFYKATPINLLPLGDEIYDEQYELAKSAGIFTEEELLEFLQNEQLWLEKDEKDLDLAQKDIENFKVGLYQNLLKSHDRHKIRLKLEDAKRELERLFTKKHRYDHFTCESVANLARYKFLTMCSLFKSDNLPLWEDPETQWREYEADFESSVDIYCSLLHSHAVTELQLRELSHTDPWLTVWSLRESVSAGIFKGTVPELTNEQSSLLVWSGVYDNIRKHPQCPADSVLDDDDMLDGWMIIQRREAERDRAQQVGDDTITNPRIRNSQEVMLVPQSKEDLETILNKNDAEGRGVLKERQRVVKEAGGEAVSIQKMPDQIRKVQMAANAKYIQAMKGK